MYVSLTGTLLGGSAIGSADFTGTPQGSIYQSFADVTSLVQAAGSGTYTVANVQAALRDANGNLPYMGSYAGWSLVVAYSDPAAPERNLTVFDGYAVQQSNDPNLNIPISGFVAPPKGAVNAEIGVVAYEGDLGTTGDSMALNGKQLSDAANPANNFFNSVISNLGVAANGQEPELREPDGLRRQGRSGPRRGDRERRHQRHHHPEHLGRRLFPRRGDHGDRPLRSEPDGDQDFHGPHRRRRPSGSGPAPSRPATFCNTPSRRQTRLPAWTPPSKVVLTDPIPTNTQYVPGSLRIVSGANAGSKTDAAGDDQAEFNAASNAVVFRLGAGANASSGGTLAVGDSTTITFQVQVNPGAPANTMIANRATTAFQGVTTGLSLSSTSNLVAVSVVGSTTIPVPTTVTLGTTPVTLKDTADLEGGVNPTGTITFTLFRGGAMVDTETVDGQRQRHLHDADRLHPADHRHGDRHLPVERHLQRRRNNKRVSDNNDPTEQVTVSTASPTLTTTPTPTTVTLGTTLGDAEGHGGPGRRLSTRPARSPSRWLRRAAARWTRRRSRSAATAPTRRRPASPCRPPAR